MSTKLRTINKEYNLYGSCYPCPGDYLLEYQKNKCERHRRITTVYYCQEAGKINEVEHWLTRVPEGGTIGNTTPHENCPFRKPNPKIQHLIESCRKT
ncbi:MAG: hypothetical protein FWE31_03070 [Firmicutes bacterium]|nr:hypothetical protein [Bacillota bacterium]